MKLEQPINIIVSRKAAIGDVIMITGVIRELKKRYGANSNIDVITEKLGVFRNNPHVRTVMHPSSDIDLNDYDIYINLDDCYEKNLSIHYVDNFFYRTFGTIDMDKSVELFPSEADIARVDKDLEQVGDKFIVVHLRNWYWPVKNISMDVWFDIFVKLFEQRTDFKVVVVGGSTDHFVPDHPLFLDYRDRYTDQEMKHLCDKAVCFVGIDSGPYWVAAASKTHIVALLTNLLPERILPHRYLTLGGNCTAFQTLEDCAGCNDEQVRPIRQHVCKKNTHPCVNKFDTDAIVKAILEQLDD